MIREFKNTIRNSLVILFALAGFSALQGQINCDISIFRKEEPVTPPLCSNEEYIFSAPFYENTKYEWKKDGIVQEDYVSGDVNRVYIIIEDESFITLNVTDTLTQETCSSMLNVTIHPKFTIDFKQLQLTCTNSDTANGNTAKMQAIAKGDMEPGQYHYFWDVKPIQIAPGDSSVAIGLMAYQKYFITVKDNFGCRVNDTAWTEGYPNPKIQLYADPDTAYLQNPYITFSYVNLSEDTIPVTSHFWDFGDDSPTTDLDVPTHAYDEEGTYMVSLTVFNFQGCDTIYDTSVLIKPVNLFIPNVFTPNGDGANDYFVITEAKAGHEGGQGGQKSMAADGGSIKPVNAFYKSTELYIFNRWGRIVYQSNNYQNDWDGGNLPDGVYFYVLKAYGEKSNDVFKGSVTIFGKSK